MILDKNNFRHHLQHQNVIYNPIHLPKSCFNQSNLTSKFNLIIANFAGCRLLPPAPQAPGRPDLYTPLSVLWTFCCRLFEISLCFWHFALSKMPKTQNCYFWWRLEKFNWQFCFWLNLFWAAANVLTLFVKLCTYTKYVEVQVFQRMQICMTPFVVCGVICPGSGSLWLISQIQLPPESGRVAPGTNPSALSLALLNLSLSKFFPLFQTSLNSLTKSLFESHVNYVL